MGLLAVALAVPGHAAAMTLVTPRGHVAPQPWQRWTDAAQRRLWAPDVRVTFTRASCPDWGAEAWGCAGPSEVWVRVSLRDRVWARWTLDHELGHLVDFSMGDARRNEVALLLGWAHWRPEAFADSWARCANPRAFLAGVMRRIRPLCRLLATPPQSQPVGEGSRSS